MSGRSPDGSGYSRVEPQASPAEPSIPNALLQRAFVILYESGHRTLAIEMARETGLLPNEPDWHSHPDDECPVMPFAKIVAVMWAQGGVHSWGIPCRADEFAADQWRDIAAYRLAPAIAIEARSDATGTGAAEGESAGRKASPTPNHPSGSNA